MKVVVAAFNEEKALVGAFSMIVYRLIVYTALATNHKQLSLVGRVTVTRARGAEVIGV